MGKTASRKTYLLSPKSRKRHNRNAVNLLLLKYKNLRYKNLVSTSTNNKNESPASISELQQIIVKRTKKVINRPKNKIVTSEVESFQSPADNSDFSQSTEGERILNRIKHWSVKNSITRTAFGELLKILKSHQCFAEFPVDPRTVYNATFTSELITIGSGNMVYFGIQKNMKKIVNDINGDVIQLQINIDGIPLFKSSNIQFWPILGSLLHSKTVFPVAIYCGNQKPGNLVSFLEQFVLEATHLRENGCHLNGQKYGFNISQIICDAPARAFICAIKNHTGYYGCGKCEIKGKYVDQRVVFIKTDANLRTNASFRDQSQPSHHIGVSPLTNLHINLIDNVIYDYMHLVCLGVTRKLIKLWTDGRRCNFRLHHKNVTRIFENLLNYAKCLPWEFNRKGRSLKELDRWKATEFRTFLLYTGPIALKNVLEPDFYNHILVLSIAIRVLAEPCQTETYIKHAEELLLYFVLQFKNLYGKTYMSYNVHGLIHLANDVRNHGRLDSISAFKFENYLGGLKKLVRSTKSPLVQVINRINERDRCEIDSTEDFSNSHSLGPYQTTNGGQFSWVELHSCRVSSHFPNNIVRLSGDRIVEVKKIIRNDKQKTKLIVSEFQIKSDFFTYPCKSSLLGIFKIKLFEQGAEFSLKLRKVKQKCVCVKLTDLEAVVIPLIHL